MAFFLKKKDIEKKNQNLKSVLAEFDVCDQNKTKLKKKIIFYNLITVEILNLRSIRFDLDSTKTQNFHSILLYPSFSCIKFIGVVQNFGRLVTHIQDSKLYI